MGWLKCVMLRLLGLLCLLPLNLALAGSTATPVEVRDRNCDVEGTLSCSLVVVVVVRGGGCLGWGGG